LQSCINGRWLRDREHVLVANKIKGSEQVTKDELKLLCKQNPNRRIPNINIGKYNFSTTPFLWFYLFGREFFYEDDYKEKIKSNEDLLLKIREQYKKDSINNFNLKDSIAHAKAVRHLNKKLNKQKKVLKNGNWVMRVMGEAPALLDSIAILETKEQMKIYYQGKGFLKAQIKTELDTLDNNITVNYIINEGKVSKIKQFSWIIKDTMLNEFVSRNMKGSNIQVGNIYSETNISNERERITKLLKDNGYFDFARQYINFTVDTTNVYEIVLTLNIESPENELVHKRYVIQKVIYDFDHLSTLNVPIETSLYQSINYNFYKKRYPKRILNGRNELYPMQFYSATNAQKTQQQIAGIDMFKFVSVEFEKIDSLDNKLIAKVSAQSLPKYQLSDEWGFTVGQGQGYPGPVANVNLINRNIFKNAEMLSFNVRGAVEGQPSVLDLNKYYKTYDYSGNVSLTYPQLIMPARLRERFDKFNPKTRFIFSYQNVIRPEYTRGISKGSLNYILQMNNFERIIFSPVDISVLNTTKKSDDFETRLQSLSRQGNYLINSFSRSMITSMNFSYLFNNNDPYTNNKSYQLRGTAEMGGMLFHMMELFGVLDKSFFLNNNELFGLNYYKFVKLNIDYRKYIPTSKTGTLAYRLNGGIGKVFGGANALPYEKYFFIGGSNSVRAWAPRRLGIGADTSKRINPNGTINYSTEQPGEIILEGSVEKRFKVYKFIDAALFVDAGNIWNFKRANVTKQSDFNIKNFYKQIALGAGYGLRFNFTYVIVRFDFGYKLYDPLRNEGERWRINKIGLKKPFGETDQFIYQIGIGYPF